MEPGTTALHVRGAMHLLSRWADLLGALRLYEQLHATPLPTGTAERLELLLSRAIAARLVQAQARECAQLTRTFRECGIIPPEPDAAG